MCCDFKVCPGSLASSQLISSWVAYMDGTDHLVINTGRSRRERGPGLDQDKLPSMVRDPIETITGNDHVIVGIACSSAKLRATTQDQDGNQGRRTSKTTGAKPLYRRHTQSSYVIGC